MTDNLKPQDRIYYIPYSNGILEQYFKTNEEAMKCLKNLSKQGHLNLRLYKLIGTGRVNFEYEDFKE